MGWKHVSLVLVATLALCACSPAEKNPAGAKLDEALALEQHNDLLAARTALGDLLYLYPDSAVVPQALEAQQRILARLETLKQQLSKTLESLVMVIAGYQSSCGKPLCRIRDLDGGEYFFGTEYLVAAVPQEVEAYILLEGGEGYGVWVYRPEYRLGMKKAGLNAPAILFAGDEELAGLPEGRRSEKIAGNVTALVPVTAAP